MCTPPVPGVSQLPVPGTFCSLIVFPSAPRLPLQTDLTTTIMTLY